MLNICNFKIYGDEIGEELYKLINPFGLQQWHLCNFKNSTTT